MTPPPGKTAAAPTPRRARFVALKGCIKLVAIDLDGTLLASDKTLSPASVLAITRCQKMGVKVVLATARPPRSVAPIYRALKLDTLQINYNGALIYDPARYRNLYHKPMAPDLVRQVIAAARRADKAAVVSIEILDKWYTDHYDPTLPTEVSLKFQPDFIGPLDAFLTVPVTKLMLLAPPARLKKITDAVAHKFAGQVNLAASDLHLLQVMHKAVDKGKAVKRVADFYGIPRAQVMAIGDAPNDCGMLKWAALGVAVANAWPAVMQAAQAVVPSNNENGVAAALQQFIIDPGKEIPG